MYNTEEHKLASESYSMFMHPNNETMLFNFTTLPMNTTTTATKTLNFTWVEYVGMTMSLIILVVGMAGNILTTVVMRRKAFLASSACIYLPSMAIFDSIFLITGIPFEWVSWFDIDIDSWSCRFHRFFFYGSGDISIWILVAFTFDRFIAVCFPFKKSFFCNPRKATLTTGLCVLLGVFKNAHLFWTRGIEMKKGEIVRMCGQVEEYRYFEKFVRPWIAFVSVSVIPFVSIIVFNASIVHHLIKSQKSRPEGYSGRQSAITSNKSSVYNSGRDTLKCKNEAATGKKDNKSFYQTTAMCLSVSFAFLVFIAPTVVIHIGKPYWKKYAYFDAFKTINNMFVYVNHSINFYLYCLTGVRFRTEISTLFRGKAKRPYSIVSGLSPRFNQTRNASVLTSEVKDSTFSSEQTESQGFTDAAIALALHKDLSSSKETD